MASLVGARCVSAITSTTNLALCLPRGTIFFLEVIHMSACGYRKLQLDRTRYRWLISVTHACITWADAGSQRCNANAAQRSQNSNSSLAKTWYSVANGICQAYYSIAKVLGLLGANIINTLWLLI